VRVLLDECVPRKLKASLSGHNVFTVPEMGWASIKNGRLLRLAEDAFDVFVTVDRGIRHQQNLSGYNIAVVLLVVRRNKLEHIEPLVPNLIEAITNVLPGGVSVVGSR
jgi:hypothetical protein